MDSGIKQKYVRPHTGQGYIRRTINQNSNLELLRPLEDANHPYQARLSIPSQKPQKSKALKTETV